MSNINTQKNTQSKVFYLTMSLSILALILSGFTFWYTFLRSSELFISLPPNILLQKMGLTTHAVHKELPCMVMTISFSAFGPKSVAIEDVFIKVQNKGDEFYFSPKREIIGLIVPNEGKPDKEAPEPDSTIMRPIHLAPNSSYMANYVFTPYDDSWKPYPCIGELTLTLYAKIDGQWIQKDENVYINTHANWESMRGFEIVSYSDRESSIKKLSEKK